MRNNRLNHKENVDQFNCIQQSQDSAGQTNLKQSMLQWRGESKQRLPLKTMEVRDSPLSMFSHVLIEQSFGQTKKSKSSEINFAAERHWAVLIPNERQCMVPLTSQGIYWESQLVWLLNPLSQIKSVPEREREREGGGSRKGMLEVPPASISAKPKLTLSLRHMNTHARSHLGLTPYNILHTGPPDGSSIWSQAKAGAHQPNRQTSSSLVWLVTLQVIIQPHASFYVAFLAAPIPRSAISEGIIS